MAIRARKAHRVELTVFLVAQRDLRFLARIGRRELMAHTARIVAFGNLVVINRMRNRGGCLSDRKSREKSTGRDNVQ